MLLDCVIIKDNVRENCKNYNFDGDNRTRPLFENKRKKNEK